MLPDAVEGENLKGELQKFENDYISTSDTLYSTHENEQIMIEAVL